MDASQDIELKLHFMSKMTDIFKQGNLLDIFDDSQSLMGSPHALDQLIQAMFAIADDNEGVRCELYNLPCMRLMTSGSRSIVAVGAFKVQAFTQKGLVDKSAKLTMTQITNWLEHASAEQLEKFLEDTESGNIILYGVQNENETLY